MNRAWANRIFELSDTKKSGFYMMLDGLEIKRAFYLSAIKKIKY